MPILVLAATLALLILPAFASARAHDYHDLRTEDGTLRYALVLPPDHDPSIPTPVLLALPPGGQDQSMVEAGLSRYWGEQAAVRGWVVVSPVAEPGRSFFTGSERLITPLIDHIHETYAVEGGRLHLAGASNGGRSAFRVAGLLPGRFHTVTVLPGYPPTDEDNERLGAFEGVFVSMFVGGDDDPWVERGAAAADELERRGVDVTFKVLPGEGHVPPSLDGDVMMKHLERQRQRALAARTLDAFHDAASRADGAAYFELMTDDASFIGTDATEHWNRDDFRDFAMPHFERGTGWTYVPRRRRLRLAPDATTAWFDEQLDNEKYGRCRGTGLLRRTPDGWRIVQYALSIPIPNAVAPEVVDRIRSVAGTDGTD